MNYALPCALIAVAAANAHLVKPLLACVTGFPLVFDWPLLALLASGDQMERRVNAQAFSTRIIFGRAQLYHRAGTFASKWAAGTCTP
jgi:hypothetical protein